MLVSLAAAAVDPPLVGRPRDHFYGAVGKQVRVTLAASRSQVRVEEELTLTLHVSGVMNAERIERPDLRQLGDYDDAFYIDDLDDGPETPRTERYFRYRLRPKHEGVREIPAILFRYYRPDLRYFATAVSDDALSLVVLPRTTSSDAAMALEAPEFLFQISTGRGLGSRGSSSDWIWYVVTWLVPPGLCLAWYGYWRWRNPGAAKLARLRRHRAVRQVLDALAKHSDAESIAAAVRNYLVHRLDLPWSAQTTSEIAAALEQLPLANVQQTAIREFFLSSDAARFGPPKTAADDLRSLARGLVLSIEEGS